MKKHTYAEITASYSLWGQYVDTAGLDTEEKFNSMSPEEKLAVLENCFGPENDTLQKILKLDSPELTPWAGCTADKLPDAAKFRIARLIRSATFEGERFNGELEGEKLDELLKLFSIIQPVHDFCDDWEKGGDATHYYVFSDGSLYLYTNAYCEVWADKADFIQERLLRLGQEFAEDSAEAQLIASNL